MKKLIALVVIATSLTAAHAGTYSKYDYNTGNSYNVTRYGKSSSMTGYNSRTGSAWSQNSTTYGNTTYQTGRSANGNSWNQTIQRGALGTTYSGTDSRGRSYSTTCGSLGCY